MTSLLDRYVIRRALSAFSLIILLVVVVVIGLDVIFRLKVLLNGDLPEGVSRMGMVARLYLFSLPTLISPLLPMAMTAAAVLACAPMLKRGEFTALAASGVSLRTATRSIVALAVLVGVTDVILSDQIAPRWEHRRQAIEDQLGGQTRSARIWKIEETGTVWYANKVILQADADPIIEGVVVAPPDIGLIHAKSLQRQDGQWVLSGPILRWQTGADGLDHWREVDEIMAEGPLALPEDGNALTQRLVSRHALTGDELLRRGGHLNMALFAGRFARLFIPLAAVLLVLPLFVSFANRDRLLMASIRSIVIALAPVLVVATGALSADSSTTDPIIVVTVSVALALAPGLWAYLRWQI